jgi:hypothetical protein
MSRERLTSKIAASRESSRKTIESRELDGFTYDKSKAKILKKVLHNVNVSLGTLISAMRDVSMIRGSEITPDGKLGGKGFIMSFKDIKMDINEAVSKLSDITDTISDELTNPMWGLSSTEKKKVKKEQEEIEDKVEEAEEEIQEDINEEPEQIEEKEVGEEPEEVTEEVVEEEEEVKPSEKESFEEETNKYRSLLASSEDKTAGALSHKIMANLLTGEK